MEVGLRQGDITTVTADAIVNAANSSLLGGGGVDGAIHRVGGPDILAGCQQLRAERFKRGLPTGEAAATTAGNLPARWVIHTVGPVYAPGTDRAGLLRSCYVSSLRVADSLGVRSIAFPLISAGIYGWPKDDAITQALDALQHADTRVAHAELVLFDLATLHLAQRIFSGE